MSSMASGLERLKWPYRLARPLAETPQYWLNLQADYDLKTAALGLGRKLSHVHEYTAMKKIAQAKR